MPSTLLDGRRRSARVARVRDEPRSRPTQFIPCSPTLRQCSSLPFRLSATIFTSLTRKFLVFRGSDESSNRIYASPHSSARINLGDGFWNLGDLRLVVDVCWICISLFVFFDPFVCTVERQQQRGLDHWSIALLHHYCWSSEGGRRIGVDHSVGDTGSFKVYDQRADGKGWCGPYGMPFSCSLMTAWMDTRVGFHIISCSDIATIRFDFIMHTGDVESHF